MESANFLFLSTPRALELIFSCNYQGYNDHFRAVRIKNLGREIEYQSPRFRTKIQI